MGYFEKEYVNYLLLMDDNGETWSEMKNKQIFRRISLQILVLETTMR